MDMSHPYPLALVAGASGTLGGAIALALAQRGYAVGLHYHSARERALDLANQVERMGRPVFMVPANLMKEDEITGLFEQVTRWGYPLSVFVYAVGMFTGGTLLDTPSETWDALFALNLRAAWLCARTAAPLMQANGGVIINLTDCGSQKLWTSHAAYVLSKGAQEHLTQLLAKTLAPSIRVNAVAPGMITPGTEMSTGAWEQLVARLPLKRSGTPEAVAQAVLSLIENDQVTGQILRVDGGYHLL